MKVLNKEGHRFVFVPNYERDLDRKVVFESGQVTEISQETLIEMRLSPTASKWFERNDRGRERLVVVPDAPPAPAPVPEDDEK